MDKNELAGRLNGRQYLDELRPEDVRDAYNSGLVIVFGSSDDTMLFRGAMHSSTYCYGGGKAYIEETGTLLGACKCGCKWYKEAKEKCKYIEAVWCDPDIGAAWSYKTDMPHSVFNIMEDDELYCRGIVFGISDVKESRS